MVGKRIFSRHLYFYFSSSVISPLTLQILAKILLQDIQHKYKYLHSVCVGIKTEKIFNNNTLFILQVIYLCKEVLGYKIAYKLKHSNINYAMLLLFKYFKTLCLHNKLFQIKMCYCILQAKKIKKL